MRGEWEIFVQDFSRVTPAPCAEIRTQARHARRWFWCNFKSALDQQFLLWAHTSHRLQTQLLEVRGTEVSSWQTEASAEMPYFALHYFNKPTALMWLVLGHRQGKNIFKCFKNFDDIHHILRNTTPNARHLLILQHKTRWRHAALSLWTIYICNISCLLRENTMIRLIWKTAELLFSTDFIDGHVALQAVCNAVDLQV